MSDQSDGAATERRAILATAADYIESWLDGDSERMSGCLHPQLVKREVERGGSAPGGDLDTETRDSMVAATAQGYGRRYDRPYETTILDVSGDMASVRVVSTPYVDHLQMARVADRWLIVNALWQRRP